MSSERKDTLKKRLDENYTVFIESLQEKTVSELIAMAPEITAVKQLHEELLDACDEEDVEFLLRFDDPLEVVCGYWESELTGYDHSGEMGHMLWDIRDRELYEKEQLAQTPENVGGAVQAENVSSFQHDGVTNLLFPFEDVKLNIGKFAMWRIQTHGRFGGTWLSDYVPNRLGGFVQKEQQPQKPRMELLGQDGNIFGILGQASRLLKRAGMKEQSDEMYSRVTACGNYYEALNIISEYVETELSPPAAPQKSTKKKARNTHER